MIGLGSIGRSTLSALEAETPFDVVIKARFVAIIQGNPQVYEATNWFFLVRGLLPRIPWDMQRMNLTVTTFWRYNGI